MAKRSWGTLGCFVMAAVAVDVACVGDDPTPSAPTDGSSSGATSSGGSSGTTSSSGAASSSGSSGGICKAGEKSCDGNSLDTCKSDGTGFDVQTCANGCVATPTPHCKSVVPSATGVTVADLDGAGLMPLVLTVNATINTDTGLITNNVRTANTAPGGREIISGIAFHTADIPGATGKKIGIFSFGGLTVAEGKTLTAIGTNALAITSSGDVKVVGMIDARGDCLDAKGGPGGGNGAKPGVAATGGDPTGAGKNGISDSSDQTCAGSGGGHGDSGGSGPSFPGSVAGGLNYGAETLLPFVGGSGGGRGGDVNSGAATTGGNGGGGGGAIQIVSATKIVIGGLPAGIMGINAGGCGGGGAKLPASSGTLYAGAGGGGGSGGSILLEAPDVRLDSNGRICANGGAGGGGGKQNGGSAVSATDGTPGAMTTDQTSSHGGTGYNGGGAGGYGGASNVNTSTNKGQNGTYVMYCGGGAGGGAGRIRINTATGTMTVADGTGFLSPRLEDTSSHAEKPSTQGTLEIK